MPDECDTWAKAHMDNHGDHGRHNRCLRRVSLPGFVRARTPRVVPGTSMPLRSPQSSSTPQRPTGGRSQRVLRARPRKAVERAKRRPPHRRRRRSAGCSRSWSAQTAARSSPVPADSSPAGCRGSVRTPWRHPLVGIQSILKIICCSAGNQGMRDRRRSQVCAPGRPGRPCAEGIVSEAGVDHGRDAAPRFFQQGTSEAGGVAAARTGAGQRRAGR
jgi:hypothetical protein